MAEVDPKSIRLGKIKSLEVKYYDDNPANSLGVLFELGSSFSGWGVTDFIPLDDLEYNKTLQDHMKRAQVIRLQSLVGKPIRAIMDGSMLANWEILEECI